MTESNNQIDIFKEHRQRLFGIAYRMLGMKEDVEDILQEAYLRWHTTNIYEIRSPEAWLVTIVTRLSIDRLRAVKVERENYVGPWLPEPLLTDFTPEEQLEFTSNLSLAFMVLLERLSPVERAAFLLHDVFDCSYSEIARIIGKSETACRQVIHRARTRVRADKPRFMTNENDRKRLIEKFTAAINSCDEEALLSLFAEDALLMSDGGGKVAAARKIVSGRRKIVRLYYLLGLKQRENIRFRLLPINGQIGVVTYFHGKLFSAATFETDGKNIQAVYQLLNPAKLKNFIDEDILKEPVSQ